MNNLAASVTAPSEYKYYILLGLYVGFILQSITVSLCAGLLTWGLACSLSATGLLPMLLLSMQWPSLGPKRAHLMVYLGGCLHNCSAFILRHYFPSRGWPHNTILLFFLCQKRVGGPVVATLSNNCRTFTSLSGLRKTGDRMLWLRKCFYLGLADIIFYNWILWSLFKFSATKASIGSTY